VVLPSPTPIAVGLQIVVLAAALTAKTMDLLVTTNVVGRVRALVRALVANGLRIAVLAGALTAKTMDPLVTSNVVVERARPLAAGVQLRRQGIGIAVEVVAAKG